MNKSIESALIVGQAVGILRAYGYDEAADAADRASTLIAQGVSNPGYSQATLDSADWHGQYEDRR